MKNLFLLAALFLTLNNILFAQSILIQENFNSCNQPANWTNNIIQGQDSWQFGNINNSNSSFDNMNGTCMLYFDDDGLGENAPSSVVQIISPVFTPGQFTELNLIYDVHFRQYADSRLSVLLFNGEQTFNLKTYQGDNVTGSQFESFQTDTINISEYRSSALQIIFEYNDDGIWGWWTGIDNFKVTGDGFINDICDESETLIVGAACHEADMSNSIFSGSGSSCFADNKGSLWFDFIAPVSGKATIFTKAEFNDVITVYNGSCNSLAEIDCTNKDEFGFEGEKLALDNLSPGQNYFIRISGADKTFGSPSGSLCISIADGYLYPEHPSNDHCADAIILSYGANCEEANNYDATFDGPVPSLNNRSKADIWYRFLANADGEAQIKSNADFSEVITIYQGTCNNLTEVAGNVEGTTLNLQGLIPGDFYYVQVSSYFATTEGNLCMSLGPAPDNVNNDFCSMATALIVDDFCTQGTTEGASSDLVINSCDAYVNNGVWYKFVAPSIGKVFINAKANYLHNIILFEGSCSNLEEVSCHKDVSSCEGFVEFGSLVPNQTYYILLSMDSNYDSYEGTHCIQVLDGNSDPNDDQLALDIDVNCNGNGTATINYTVLNSAGSNSYYGNYNGQIIEGQGTYSVTVEDATGCQVTETALINCPNLNPLCDETDLDIQVNYSCSSNTGESILSFNVTGGNLPYSFSGDVMEGQIVNAGTSYTYLVTDNIGCTKLIADIVPTTHSQVEPEILSLPSIVTGSNILLLDAYPQGGVFSGPGISGNSFSIMDAGIGNHTISYEYIDEENCKSEAYQNISVLSFTSTFSDYDPLINANNFSDFVKVFPNPVETDFNITIPSLTDSKNVEVSIYNLEGKILFSKKLDQNNGNQFLVSLSNFDKAVYLLYVKVDDLLAVKKIVKQ